jgi:hypothetical protein
VGTRWRRNKASKGYVAARRQISLVKAIKWGMYELVFSMCQKGGAPLLERWRILERAAYLLRGGAPLLHIWLTLGMILACRRGGSPYLTTWLTSPHTWCALLLLAFAFCAIYSSILSHCELVGVWGLLHVVLYYCNTFHLE